MSHCFEHCQEFREDVCERLNRAPYVCNGCEREHNCPLRKRYYIASSAQANYRGTLSNCRRCRSPESTEYTKVHLSQYSRLTLEAQADFLVQAMQQRIDAVLTRRSPSPAQPREPA